MHVARSSQRSADPHAAGALCIPTTARVRVLEHPSSTRSSLAGVDRSDSQRGGDRCHHRTESQRSTCMPHDSRGARPRAGEAELVGSAAGAGPHDRSIAGTTARSRDRAPPRDRGQTHHAVARKPHNERWRSASEGAGDARAARHHRSPRTRPASAPVSSPAANAPAIATGENRPIVELRRTGDGTHLARVLTRVLVRCALIDAGIMRTGDVAHAGCRADDTGARTR